MAVGQLPDRQPVAWVLQQRHAERIRRAVAVTVQQLLPRAELPLVACRNAVSLSVFLPIGTEPVLANDQAF
jgi:hypothetical protein|eukprot:COSAG06_NODE_3402_length_5394_cov_12.090115_2_plen_71_part_00